MNKSIIASFVAAACVFSGSAMANGDLAYARVAKDSTCLTSLQSRVTKAQSAIEQNSAVNTVPTSNWTDRIAVGGLINAEFAYGSDSPIGRFTDTNSATDLYINNANLFVDAKINPWVNAHVNLAYIDDNAWGDKTYSGDTNPRQAGVPGNLMTNRGSRLLVDEAYVKIGNLARTPFYAEVGKEYVDFGTYNRYPVFIPFTQLMTQTRATALTLGVVTDLGFYGSAFGFAGQTAENTESTLNMRNFGFKVGYFGTMHNVGLADAHYDVNASWIRNMFDTDALVHWGLTNYAKRADGLSLHGDLFFDQFELSANYVKALGTLVATNTAGTLNLIDGRIWSADVNGRYHFCMVNRASSVGLSYQWTGDAQSLVTTGSVEPTPGVVGTTTAGSYVALPHRRYMADMTMTVWNMTDVTLAFAHDVSYKNTVIGTQVFASPGTTTADKASTTNTLIVRGSVRF